MDSMYVYMCMHAPAHCLLICICGPAVTVIFWPFFCVCTSILNKMTCIVCLEEQQTLVPKKEGSPYITCVHECAFMYVYCKHPPTHTCPFLKESVLKLTISYHIQGLRTCVCMHIHANMHLCLYVHLHIHTHMFSGFVLRFDHSSPDVSIFAIYIRTHMCIYWLWNMHVPWQLVFTYDQLSTHKEGCAKMNRAYICVEMESFLSEKYRLKLYNEMRFDEPLEFDSSDEGPSGGIQVCLCVCLCMDFVYILCL